MGIHVHVKGKPDMCRCCAIVDRLNELWDRTHNSVLSVNGIYADGNGNVLIPGIQDISDLREEVQTLGERVTNDRTYLEAVAEDVAEIGTLVPGLATLNTEQTFTATKYIGASLVFPEQSDGQQITLKSGGQGGNVLIFKADGTGETGLEIVRTKGQSPYVRFNTPPIGNAGSLPLAGVTKEWVWQTAANADNGLLHRTANETKEGELTLKPVPNSSNMIFPLIFNHAGFNVTIGRFVCGRLLSGQYYINLDVRNGDNTWTTVRLGTGVA